MTTPIGKDDIKHDVKNADGEKPISGAVRSSAIADLADRMRARVRFPWRNAIEASKACHLQEVDIWEDKSVSVDDISRSYPIDIVKRVAPVATVGQLAIFVTDWPAFIKDYGNLILKDLKKIHKLRLVDENGVNAEEVLIDSLFMGFARRCQVLDVDILGSVTAQGLYRLYQKMVRSSVPLMFFYVSKIEREKREEFLELEGITFKEGIFAAKKKTFQVFSEVFYDYGHYYYIIDGNGMEISFYESNRGRRRSLSIKAPKFSQCPEYETMHNTEYNFVAEVGRILKREEVFTSQERGAPSFALLQD